MGGDSQGLLQFAAWARALGTPALCVELTENEARIGPLALPGRPGCERCALERMAAAASEPYTGTGRPSRQVVLVAGPMIVREVRAIIRKGPERSQLLDHVLAIAVESLDAALHQVIPLCRCSLCGGAAAFPLASPKRSNLSSEDSLEDVLGALAGWIDQRTGVISTIYVEPPSNSAVGFPFIVTAAPPRVMNEDGSLRQLPLGWGKGLTVPSAVLSAIGEAIERYSASLPDSERIIWERPDDLDGEFVDPRSFALYTDAQYEQTDFPYARFDPGIRHPWILGKWLGTGGPVWVPAALAFLSLTLRSEHLTCPGTSNGLAAFTDPEEAALRATLELVERDAFMAAWLTACPGLRVDLDDTLDPLLRPVLRGMEALEATVEVYTLPTSVCGTTVLCLGLGDGDQYPGVTIGLGTDFDLRTALRQAMLELAQTGPHLQRMMRSNALQVPSDPSSVRQMLDHAAYYFPVERAPVFDRLRKGGDRIALRDLDQVATKRSLEICASALDLAGVKVALVDVTSADVATGPFRVVRAVSADLQSLFFGYNLQQPPVQRIRNMKLAADIPAIHPIW